MAFDGFDDAVFLFKKSIKSPVWLIKVFFLFTKKKQQ